MSETIERERVGAIDAVSIEAPRALKQARSLIGIRVYDVGQGDAIAVLDEDSRPVLLVDYGGRQGSPFSAKKKRHNAKRSVDAAMPVAGGALVMITHWDEDHWSSAPKGTAARGADWLVPRQVTSPRAVRFSTSLANISCIPEARVGQIFEFAAQNGDSVLWQKIAPSSPDPSIHENCNRTGVALALVRRSEKGRQAILIPGDAPFHEVPLFEKLAKNDHTLTGLVAFHHGAGTHWTKATQEILKTWPRTGDQPCEVVFSCSSDNSYGHPHQDRYKQLMPTKICCTFDLRAAGSHHTDILFR